MFGSFLEALGQNLADRWAGVAVPALIFWGGGFAAYLSSHGGTAEWTDLTERFENLGGTTQVLIVTALLLGVAVSATVIQWLARPALKALRGDWRWLGEVQSHIAGVPEYLHSRGRLAWLQRFTPISRHERYEKNEAGLKRLFKKDPSTWEATEYREWQTRNAARHWLLTPEDRTPTRLGDLLTVHEWWPEKKYGLRTDICLPRLWLVLPQASRDELRTARAQLDGALAAWVWAVLFIAWTPWAWWAPLVSIAVAPCIYYGWILRAAASYGDLMESTFDVHRGPLYDEANWPKPESISDEVNTGRDLCDFLAGGPDARASDDAGAVDGDSS